MERDVAHLLTPLFQIEKGLCALRQKKTFRDFFNSSD